MRSIVKRAHPRAWTERGHFGQCGQSCPCCRFVVESAQNPDPASWFGVEANDDKSVAS